MRVAILFVLAALLLPSCRTAAVRPSAERPTELAARPQPVASSPPTSSASAPPSRSASSSPRASRSSSGSPSPTGSARPRDAARVADPSGDATPGPAYADLREVRIEDLGVDVRVTVSLNGAIPRLLPQGEVEGVGVDLFRDASSGESDYQLFADGEPDGWFAYLEGPSGFVAYPGTFGLDQDRLIFEVPWSALGGLRSGFVSSFCDWSGTTVVLNATSSDRAPDGERARYS